MAQCEAKIRPMFPASEVEIRCTKEAEDGHSDHRGELVDYAYPGSKTTIAWLNDDRRTYTGQWKQCPAGKPGGDGDTCILPMHHEGNHAY